MLIKNDKKVNKKIQVVISRDIEEGGGDIVSL
jgi:hypothetical protein